MPQGAILTNVGLSKIASATPLDQLNVVQIAVGDGNGGYPALTPDMTGLVNEVWRGPASNPIRDPNNGNILIFEAQVPALVGPFSIREQAIFDDEGDMIAIGQTSLVEKPDPSSAVGVVATMRLHVALSNASQVDLFYTDTAATHHNSLTNRDEVDSHPASAISMQNGESVEFEIKKSEERSFGKEIYLGNNGKYIQNGDSVPTGTSITSIKLFGLCDIVSKIDGTTQSGVISNLNDTTKPYSATIGGVDCWLFDATKEKNTGSWFFLPDDSSDATEQFKAMDSYMKIAGNAIFMDERDFTISEQIGSEGDGFNNHYRLSGIARILYNPPLPTKYVIAHDVGAKRVVSISEGIEIDVNDNAYSGLAFYNNQIENSDSVNSFSYIEASVSNVYRSGTDFTGGDAILVKGSFATAMFNGKINGVKLAFGAGIPLTQGVSGYRTSHYSDTCYVENSIVGDMAVIKNVYSEDTTYEYDQDGYVALGPDVREVKTYAELAETAVVEGCAGRHVKTQTNDANIHGVHNVTRGNNGKINSVVSCQYGGSFTNAKVNIFGITPSSVFGHGGYSGNVETASAGFFDDVTITSDVALPLIYQTFPRDNFSGDANIGNVDIKAEVAVFGEMLVNGVDRFDTIKGVKIEKLTEALIKVLASGGNSPYLDTLSIEDCVNKDTTTTPALVLHRQAGVSATAVVTENNNKGFTGNDYGVVVPTNQLLDPGFTPRKITATDVSGGIVPRGAYIGEATSVDNNGTVTVSQRGRNARPSGFYFIIASTEAANKSAGFYADHTQTVDFTGGTVGADFSFGTTSNPNTAGKVNVWVDGTTGKININNQVGESLNITIHSLT